jgi:hypothetical protein
MYPMVLYTASSAVSSGGHGFSGLNLPCLHVSEPSRSFFEITYTIEFANQNPLALCCSDECITDLLSIRLQSFVQLILQLLHQVSVLDFGIGVD